MPTVTLKFKENIIGEYQIEKGKSLTIGRQENNDITIENLAVSGHHAKIDSVGDGFLLTDLQSKNGTFVNNELITTHWLKHNDAIAVGKHSLVFAFAEGDARPEEKAASAMDQTMVMDTEKYREMLAKAKGKVAEETQLLKGEPAATTIGVLSFLAGGAGEVVLAKKLIKIGKDSSSDIVVSGLTVAKTAATISRRPNGYYLSYVGGMAKPKVNSEVVKESVLLNEFDTIELGSAKMQFITKAIKKK